VFELCTSFRLFTIRSFTNKLRGSDEQCCGKVCTPARTGRESNRRIIVNKMAQTNNGIRSSCIPLERMFIVVVIKLIDLIIDLQ